MTQFSLAREKISHIFINASGRLFLIATNPPCRTRHPPSGITDCEINATDGFCNTIFLFDGLQFPFIILSVVLALNELFTFLTPFFIIITLLFNLHGMSSNIVMQNFNT